MAQVTIYLDDELEAKMNAAAKAANLSRSKWIAHLIQKRLQDEWPDNVTALAGAWKDLPLAEEIRASHGSDAEREPV